MGSVAKMAGGYGSDPEESQAFGRGGRDPPTVPTQRDGIGKATEPEHTQRS